MLTVGLRREYQWLATDRQFDVLQLCPEIVLGKFIAITSLDSGALALNDEERAAGWESRGDIAYSPKVQDITGLPRAGYDEWYVFKTPSDLGTSHIAANIFEVPQEHGHVSVFVNYGFALSPPERAHLADLFWAQLERIRPESYISDNDYLTFVSANKALFSGVVAAVKALRNRSKFECVLQSRLNPRPGIKQIP
ncbi:MAG TPA: hypothetical protein VFA85_14550 [Terriglobales bacterium]|nr:hypothetical protein [Terriglobales bacterium]